MLTRPLQFLLFVMAEVSVNPRADKGGPYLSFNNPGIAVVEDCFSVSQTDRSPSGYTVYKMSFKV